MWDTLTKYNNLIITEDDQGWRWYGTAEQPFLYPSVTTILHETIHQPGLINWYKNNSANAIDKRLAETGAVGTELHKIFDADIHGVGIDVPPSLSQHSINFREWMLKHEVKPVKTEFVIVSERYGYAGRVDFFGEVGGKMEVVDWKTGNIFGDTWGDQVAAYQMAICEMLQVPDTEIGMRILQVARDDAKLTQFKYQHLDWMQDSFLLALERFKRVPRFTKLKKMGWPYLMKKSMVRAT